MTAERAGSRPHTLVEPVDEESVARWWRELVKRHPQAVALRTLEGDIALAELDRRSAKLAQALLLCGHGKGSRIAMLMANGPDWIIAWIATQRIGALCIFLSSFFAESELLHALRHSDAQLLLLEPSYLHHDYAARLEAALPDLAACDNTAPLLLADAPYLRSIWTTRPSGRGWAAADFAQAEDQGAAAARRAPDLLARAEAEVVATDPSLIIYTSGSTAHPKAVVHRQGAVADKIRFLADNDSIIPSATSPGDCVLVTMPLFWVGGLLSCFGALERGAIVAFSPALPASELWPLIERFGATHVTGGEAVLRSLQDHLGPDRSLCDHLKPQNSNQMAWFRGREGHDPASIGAGFGMTETLGPHSGFHGLGDTFGALRGTVGPALPGVERRIIDPDSGAILAPGETGELAVKGRWLMEGYYKQPRNRCFDPDGFFRTGDRCRIDEHGLLHFIGRDSGMLKTSGANVAPEEVEVALRQCDDVIEAVVVGLPDARRGQLVAAIVALTPGSHPDEAALRAGLRAKLSSFKIPRRFHFMPFDEMPRTASNKIDRRALARLMGAPE